MKILLTGASGYIGQYIKKVLKDRSLAFVEGNRNSFDYENIDSIREFYADKSISHVIHLAGSVSNRDCAELFNINIRGLYNLLAVSSEYQIQHVTFVSGNNVYGQYKDSEYNETDICQPEFDNIYGLSKYTGELIVRDYCTNKKIGFAIVRVADVFGPDQKHGNLMKTIIKNLKQNQPLVLYGEGKRVRDYIHVNDVSEGLLYIATNHLLGTYNLGTGTGTSVKQILGIASGIYNDKVTIQHNDIENEDTSSVILSPVKLAKAGFVARYTIEHGMKEILGEDI